MKIQMDTVAKTIKIEESVKLDKLISTLKKLLPNNEWKQFTLETNTVIHNWSSPVIIREYPVYPYHRYPWYSSKAFSIGEQKYTGTAADYSLKSGTFNLEA